MFMEKIICTIPADFVRIRTIYAGKSFLYAVIYLVQETPSRFTVIFPSFSSVKIPGSPG